MWLGVEESQRKARWSERIDRKLLDWKLTLSSLNPAVKEEIDLQLQPGYFTQSTSRQHKHSNTPLTPTFHTHSISPPDSVSLLCLCCGCSFTPPLTPKDLEDVRMVLRMDSAFNHRVSLIDGQAQLCARLLSSLSWDTRLTFATLQSINSQLKADHTDPTRFKVDALTLTSVLSRDLPELTSHLNATAFDVVDLTDQLTVFLPSVYALSYSADLVNRCVDILLLDPLGASFLFSLFYGILRVNVKTLLQQTEDSIFQFIADLPHSLTRQQIIDAFTFAYKGIRSKADVINAERKKKSWTHAVAQPGPILFSAEVGDASAPVAPPPPKQIGSGVSTAAPSRAMSGSNTPSVAPTSPTSTLSVGDGSITFNLRDLSTPTAGVAGGATPAASVLQMLAGAEREADVVKLREMVRVAQTHIRATTAPPPLPTSIPSHSATAPLPSLLSPIPPPKTPLTSTIKFTDLPEYLSLPCVHMEGHLLKSRQASKFLGMKTKRVGHSTLSSGLFGVTLHRRWFVLEGEFLSYFKVRGEKMPSRGEALWMRYCWIEELSEKEFGQWGFGFEIRMKTKQGGGNGGGATAGTGGPGSPVGQPATEPLFVLFTNSAKERQTWVEVLKKATGQ